MRPQHSINDVDRSQGRSLDGLDKSSIRAQNDSDFRTGDSPCDSLIPIFAALLIVGAWVGANGTGKVTDEAQANHDTDINPKVWRNWRSSFSQREIRWQKCATSDWEWTTAYLSLNNWSANFGHSTYHTYVGLNCNENNDDSLRVWARTTYAMQDGVYCVPGAPACFYGKFCYKASDPSVISCKLQQSLMNVLQGYIVYDWQWLTSSPFMNPGGMPSPIRYIHMFGHEFGHSMRLKHHDGCPETIMGGEGCTDMVDSGPAPNDVCVPDENMGYGSSRC